MKARKLPNTTSDSAQASTPPTGRDTRVAAAMRRRRQRRADEARMQSLVRKLALQMNDSGSDG